MQEVAGVPALVRCASLLDRRHILAQDATGHVELWDIATGSVVQRFGQVHHEIPCCFGSALHSLFWQYSTCKFCSEVPVLMRLMKSMADCCFPSLCG